EGTTSIVLQHFLHKPVAFFILPVFAAANTCLVIDDQWMASIGEPGSIGILLGLVAGKPIGIWLFSFLGVGVGLCSLPSDLKWKNILGAGMLGGIGFTMSIFITLLAFDDTQVINHSKMAILIASLLAGVVGFLFLNLTLKKEK
ncbi:MAG: Na(+)/H(+) antiporter NhaA, partial [Azospira oryzae]